MPVMRGYILLVEDDPGLRDVLTLRLNEMGYTVKGAVTGDEALGFVDAETPDLVISDVSLPGGMNGYWICEQLRQRFINDYIPVILITGSANERMTGLRAGADDFLSKPFNFEELAVRVKTLVRIREH